MEQRITSKQNASLQHVRKLLTSRTYRNACREFAADGIKLLQEALTWKADVRLVVLADGVACTGIPNDVRVLRVPDAVMKGLSNMSAPQGAIFVCGYPEQVPFDLHAGALILDGIQDPGNVGTILRTADAMRVPVVLCEGCADPYNEKTVRASMGAVFRTPILFATVQEVLTQSAQKNIPLAATALHETAKDIREFDLNRAAVIIGSEGQGVRRELLEAAEYKLIIPMSQSCESLNAAVAATIVLWLMKNI